MNRPGNGRPPALCYHAFGVRSGTADPNNLFVPPADFERQVRLLARVTTPLTLDAYLDGLERGRWPARATLVTIDDGFRSTLEVAAPILARHGVPAVLFALPGRLGGVSEWMAETPDEPLVTADDLQEMADHGIDVGVHGWDHRPMVGLDEVELDRQVVHSRDALADVVGRVPRALAYPYGGHDVTARLAVAEAGYRAAFTVDVGDDGRHARRRRNINTRDALWTFAVKLVPGFDAAWQATAGHPRLRRIGARLAAQRPGPAGVTSDGRHLGA